MTTLTKEQQRMESRRAVCRAWIRDYMAGRSCLDCGESDPVVLQFDHVRGEKTANVSNLIVKAYSIERIEAEVAKCDVVCANCHHRRTAKSQKWHWA